MCIPLCACMHVCVTVGVCVCVWLYVCVLSGLIHQSFSNTWASFQKVSELSVHSWFQSMFWDHSCELIRVFAVTPEPTCAGSKFRCTSGMCIDIENVCNQQNDCDDESDEQHCSEFTRLSCQSCMRGDSVHRSRWMWTWFFLWSQWNLGGCEHFLCGPIGIFCQGIVG